MGCIESIETNFAEMHERFKQIFEADKYFVENMQIVATAHSFRQEAMLCDFQFMETNKDTRELLRKFMLQLRNIDFVIVGRICLELCLKATNAKGELLNTCANYNLKQDDIRNKQQQIRAYKNCTSDEQKKAELIKELMEKLCETFNMLKAANEEKARVEELNKQLKEKMEAINVKINQLREVGTDATQLNWRDQLSSDIEDLYKQRLPALYSSSGVNGGVVPKELTLHKFKENIDKLCRGEVTPEEKPYKLDSYTRQLVFQVKKDILKKPDVNLTTHDTKQFRYLYLNQHAYHNYAKYLQDIQNELIKKWEDEYTKWQEENDEDPDTKAKAAKRLANFKIDETTRAFDVEKNAKKEQQLQNQKVAEQAEKERVKKLTKEEKETYDKDKKEKEQARLKVRVGDPGNINDAIQKDLEAYREWIVKKGQPPSLKDVINNPKFFLDDHLKYWNKGLKMVAKGRVALVLLAGDSDLKWNQKLDENEIMDPANDEKTPFGFRKTGLNSQKCLFQLFCERVEAVQRLAHMYRPDKTMLMENSRVHVYVMTNSENDFRTRKLFRKYLNFGLWAKNIHFFEQGNFPMIGQTDGQVRLRDKLRIMNLPDGTGGFYDAVNNNELLREWDFLGIKYLHVMGIDNLLARPVDPTLLGMLRGVDGVENGLEVVTKAVEALDAHENLSRIALYDTQPTVIRHADLTVNNVDCQLAVYNDFACTTEFVKKAIDQREKWETYHQSSKSYSFHALDKGECKQLSEASYVFEKDILDPLVIVQPKLFGVLQVNRRNEYAPVKRLNRSDCIAADSFDSAVVLMSLLHFRWLIDHGYQFKDMEFYTNDNLLLKEDAELQLALKQQKLEKKIFPNEEFKQFIGEKTKEEWDKEQADKKVTKEKKMLECERARKKKARRLGVKLDEVELEAPSDDDEEDVEEPVTLYKMLVEIDARQSLHGENIPQPKSYDDKQAEQNTDKEVLPYYLKSNVRPIKCKLPWKLQEIYRYV